MENQAKIPAFSHQANILSYAFLFVKETTPRHKMKSPFLIDTTFLILYNISRTIISSKYLRKEEVLMTYNKTKRGLEKAAGIVGTIVSSISLVVYALFAFTFMMADPYNRPVPYSEPKETYVILFVTLTVISILSLIFSAKVIKSPVQEDGSIEPRTSKRVCMLVFNILSGQIVSSGLMIAVLCLKDEASAKKSNPTKIQQTNSIDGKLAELKHLKELGVIDEETYKKSVQKLIKDIM